MAELPIEFTDYTRSLMGEERFERYLKSFEEEPPVSIRINPKKMEDGRWKMEDAEPVPWCRNGYYLSQRPNFTFDPLFHAGCYYVQEAASMFLNEVIRQFIVQSSKFKVNDSPTKNNYELCTLNYQLSLVLDLCAAPGGKSTLLRSALPEGCVLYSNEPVRNRAGILAENIAKWGYPNCYVTNAYPRDYRKAKMKFDLILCDVPCSGEGMFRKDEATIREWSPQQVEKCWRLQRDIVSDAWECLNEGGLLIYSTCTFNTKENEENIRWILDNYEAEVLKVETRPEWNITGSLLKGFDEPVYRFIPGISRGEGLFLCVLRKEMRRGKSEMSHRLQTPCLQRNGNGKNMSSFLMPLSSLLSPLSFDLTYQQAISYLRGEALRLPEDTPHGEVTVTFMGHPLGLVKNIGNRANNLYPKPWRIKTTHVPTEYEAIVDGYGLEVSV